MIPIIHKYIITTIIAPHGITDLIHSVQHNTTNQVVTFNGASILTSSILSHHNPECLNALFILSSVIHFRHDMPNLKFLPDYIFSCLLLKSAIDFNHNILFVYMLISHVPNHYKTNWIYIKQNTHINISFIIFFTFFLTYIGLTYPYLYDSKMIFDISKGLVISHVIYNEIYIHNNITIN